MSGIRADVHALVLIFHDGFKTSVARCAPATVTTVGQGRLWWLDNRRGGFWLRSGGGHQTRVGVLDFTEAIRAHLRVVVGMKRPYETPVRLSYLFRVRSVFQTQRVITMFEIGCSHSKRPFDYN